MTKGEKATFQQLRFPEMELDVFTEPFQKGGRELTTEQFESMGFD